ncbi:hypothetical protein [Tateyamaria sp.]|uniref:hypothetical protein n=1 Tax=Tateyamaria sp. TaxID=1929288 RepID=UPI00329B634C
MRWILITVVCVGGCGLVPERGASLVSEAVSVPAHADGTTPLRPQPRPDELATDLETTVEPPEPQVSAGTLGRTVATLGNAAEPGMWLKTPLVSTTQPGRVFLPSTGKTVDVTLIPIEGPATAGSRLSLAAMQGIGASLTDLIEVDVLAG